MALVPIEYGSLASSEVMNDNLEYLDERITEVSAEIYSNNSSLESKIDTLNISMNNSIEALEEQINSQMNTQNEALLQAISLIGADGGYITTNINGNSGYREYFSDKEKKNRVFLIQWGTVVGWQTCTFQKAYTTGCSIVAIPITSESCVSAAINWWNKNGFSPINGTHGGRHEDRPGITNFWIAIGK